LVAVTLSGFGRLFGGNFRKLLDAARMADEAGVEQLIVPDHVVMGPRTDRYPFGRFPYGPEEPWLEPLTALAAVGAVTTRLRLATGIVIAPLRPAIVLAKTAATVDVLTGGRLELGVGSGWQREEHAAAGVPFVGRTAAMEDTIRACQALWRSAPATFSSDTVSFADVWCRPAPVQPGGVPVWFGGPGNPANARRVAELGAGWLPIAGTPPDEVAGGVRLMRDAFEAAGRHPSTLGVRVGLVPQGDLESTLAAIPSLLALGATAVSLATGRFVAGFDDLPAFFRRVAAA
jgi:probable F420-dependent oxidoreductase